LGLVDARNEMGPDRMCLDGLVIARRPQADAAIQGETGA
jgi:hypothetical protein